MNTEMNTQHIESLAAEYAAKHPGSDRERMKSAYWAGYLQAQRDEEPDLEAMRIALSDEVADQELDTKQADEERDAQAQRSIALDMEERYAPRERWEP